MSSYGEQLRIVPDVIANGNRLPLTKPVADEEVEKRRQVWARDRLEAKNVRYEPNVGYVALTGTVENQPRPDSETESEA